MSKKEKWVPLPKFSWWVSELAIEETYLKRSHDEHEEDVLSAKENKQDTT